MPPPTVETGPRTAVHSAADGDADAASAGADTDAPADAEIAFGGAALSCGGLLGRSPPGWSPPGWWPVLDVGLLNARALRHATAFHRRATTGQLAGQTGEGRGDGRLGGERGAEPLTEPATGQSDSLSDVACAVLRRAGAGQFQRLFEPSFCEASCEAHRGTAHDRHDDHDDDGRGVEKAAGSGGGGGIAIGASAAAWKEASLVVGLHPDEATGAIVELALEHGKPFAVVPCCVFPQRFPDRMIVPAVPLKCPVATPLEPPPARYVSALCSFVRVLCEVSRADVPMNWHRRHAQRYSCWSCVGPSCPGGGDQASTQQPQQQQQRVAVQVRTREQLVAWLAAKHPDVRTAVIADMPGPCNTVVYWRPGASQRGVGGGVA